MNTQDFIKLQNEKFYNTPFILDYILTELNFTNKEKADKKFIPSDDLLKVINSAMRITNSIPSIFSKSNNIFQLYGTVDEVKRDEKLLSFIENSMDIPDYFMENTKGFIEGAATNNEMLLYQFLKFLTTISIGESNLLLVDRDVEDIPSRNTFINEELITPEELFRIKADPHKVHFLYAKYLIALVNTNTNTELTNPYKYLIARLLTLLDIFLYMKLNTPSLNSSNLLTSINMVVSPPEEFMLLDIKELVAILLLRIEEVSITSNRLNNPLKYRNRNEMYGGFNIDNSISADPFSLCNLIRFLSGDFLHLKDGAAFPEFIGTYMHNSIYLFMPSIGFGIRKSGGDSFIGLDESLDIFSQKVNMYLSHPKSINYKKEIALPNEVLFSGITSSAISWEIVRAFINSETIRECRNKRELERTKNSKPSILLSSLTDNILLKEKLSTEEPGGDKNILPYLVAGKNSTPYQFNRVPNMGVLNSTIYPSISVASSALSKLEKCIGITKHKLLEENKELNFPTYIYTIANLSKTSSQKMPFFLAISKGILGMLIPTNRHTINYLLAVYGLEPNDYFKYCDPVSDILRSPSKNGADVLFSNMCFNILNYTNDLATMTLKYRKGMEVLNKILSHVFYGTIKPDLSDEVDLRVFFNNAADVTTPITANDLGLFVPIMLNTLVGTRVINNDNFLKNSNYDLWNLLVSFQRDIVGKCITNLPRWFERSI